MRYDLGSYQTSWQLLLKSMSQYRSDFLIMATSALIHDGATLLFIDVIFNNVRDIQGWSFYEVVFIYGLMITTRAYGTPSSTCRIASIGNVRQGSLDGLLVRPPSVLFQIATQSGYNPSAFGRIVVGVVAILIALRGLDVTVASWWAIDGAAGGDQRCAAHVRRIHDVGLSQLLVYQRPFAAGDGSVVRPVGAVPRDDLRSAHPFRAHLGATLRHARLLPGCLPPARQ